MTEKAIIKAENVTVSFGDFQALKGINAEVKQGEIIGTVGSTGRSTGAHLDVRLNWFGTRLDPASVLDFFLHFQRKNGLKEGTCLQLLHKF